MNETILNNSTAFDMGTAKVVGVSILEYVRQGVLNLSTLIAKFFPFDPQNISIIIFIVASMWIASKIIDPRERANFWLLLSGGIFYLLYLF
jgi:hypothetical protein